MKQIKHYLLWILAGLCLIQPRLSMAQSETNATQKGLVYVLPIEGMIEPALLYVLRRGVAEAERNGANALVFTMDTPGGTLDAAREIVYLIQGFDGPTYTLVTKSAFSAGAIIALATDHIYMQPGTVIGDAMPISVSPLGGVKEMPEAIQEKMVSGVAAMVRSAAQQNGHDPLLAEAMVRRELEYKIGDKIICPKGQLLTLTDVEAAQLHEQRQGPLLSRGTVKNLDDLLSRIGLEHAEIRQFQVSRAEKVARMISAFAPIFLIGGLLGVYIEIKTPGFGLPGLLGLLCLAIFFWGHHIAGLAGFEDVLIFLVGIILLALEIFVIPGFGVTGILGMALIVFALFKAMIIHYPGGPILPEADWPHFDLQLLSLTGSLLASVALVGLLARYLPETRIGNRLILQASEKSSEGYVARSAIALLSPGATGVAITPLKPGGSAQFGHKKFSVVTQGEFIDAGSPVSLVEQKGMRLIVTSNKETRENA